MPTTRPRHLVTESDALEEALDDAARRWPGLSRSQLLVRLALEGHRAVVSARGRRLAAIHANAGRFTGLYRPDEREELRAEWPA